MIGLHLAERCLGNSRSTDVLVLVRRLQASVLTTVAEMEEAVVAGAFAARRSQRAKPASEAVGAEVVAPQTRCRCQGRRMEVVEEAPPLRSHV